MAVNNLWAMIESAELTALKALSPIGFDWCAARHPDMRVTPLQFVVHRLVGADSDSYANSMLDIARWLLDRGADPKALAPADCEDASCWAAEDKDNSEISVDFAGHNAISLAVAVKRALQEKQHERTEHTADDAWAFDWSSEISNMKTLLSLMCNAVTSQRIDVDVGIVAFWEQVRHDNVGQDLHLVCVGGQRLGVHAAILSAASPVVRSMLQHSMRERQDRAIELKDTPVAVASLFLDLVYTGATPTQPEHGVLIGALGLAHRWQCSCVTEMLERALVSALGDDSFEEIAEAAAEKSEDLSRLASACVRYSSSSARVKGKVRRDEFSQRVQQMLKPPASRAEGTSTKRRRCF